MTAIVDGWKVRSRLAWDGNDLIEVRGGALFAECGSKTPIPIPVLSAVLNAAGYTVRGFDQEAQRNVSATEIAHDRDTARAEVARLRALCAEAAELWKPLRPAMYGEMLSMSNRLAAAGKGEG